MFAKKKFRKGANVPKTRKQLRKEQRKNKKIKRHEHYTNRKRPGQFVRVSKEAEEHMELIVPEAKVQEKKVKVQLQTVSVEKDRAKEKKEQLKLQNEMKKQRNKQLLDANLEEDKTIKRLEKQLKLNKRKAKSIPASFATDGLDYLLEVCDSDNLKNTALSEQNFAEANDEFEEDLALMTGKEEENFSKEKEDADSDTEDMLESDDNISNVEVDDLDEDDESINELEEESDTDDSYEEEDDESENEKSLEEKDRDFELQNENTKRGNNKRKLSNSEDEYKSDCSDDVDNTKKKLKTNTWEDIYGRLRAPDGSIIKDNQETKYIPPAARLQGNENTQKQDRLKKQLKGLLNRLAESNMHSITTQIEELYMNNSRSDMNTNITSLVMDAIASNVLTPNRLLLEHVLLIVVLHANVGSEVGAHFLQIVIKEFDRLITDTSVDNKQLDNVTIILSQLYNFQVFDTKLMYAILYKLMKGFEEKDVECILHILRNVGFTLRKDSPISLKQFIFDIQKKAVNVSDNVKKDPRIKFMLDVLLAIKNNNVNKISNYDTSYAEHLKKTLKGLIRKGNYVTQLSIGLGDLLKADEKGKWWVIGSAWSGHDNATLERPVSEKLNSFSQKFLDLAAKQRMNTDTRRIIFCTIMSAEDYLDAFEKLLRLSLKNQQEREIIHVLLHCCLKEKKYNPYYAALAQKFCDYNRRFQMTIKYSIWDKLKVLKDQSAGHISNLAKLLTYLFIEKGLSISTLKIVQFSELDKITLRFMRQILLGILLCEDLENCKEVFAKVAQSDKLKMFRESLKLFMHHFLLKNLGSQGIEEGKKELLRQRVKIVEKMLNGKDSRMKFS